MRRRYVAELGLCTLAGLLTASVYGSFFDSAGYLWPVGVLAAAGAVVCALPVRARAAVGLGAAVAVAGLAELVARDTLRHGLVPTMATLTESARGLVGGWAAMLSVQTPAATSTRLLVTPVAATFTAVVGAGALARRRSVLAPMLPLVAAELIALLLVARQPGGHLAEAAALAAVLLVLGVVRADPAAGVAAAAGSGAAGTAAAGAGRAAATRLAAGVAVAAMVATCGGYATAGAPVARGTHRFDPRQLVSPPLRVQAVLSPLSAVAAQRAATPARTLFTVTGVAGLAYLQASVLEDFDGTGWSSSDTFLVAGPALAAGPAMPAAGRVDAHLRVVGLAGPYLPVPGWPTVIRAQFGAASRVGFDADSGVLVSTAARLSGGSYTVSGLRPSEAVPAGAAAGTGPARYTALPARVAPVAALADRIVAGAGGDGARAVALAAYLRQVPYNGQAPPALSYGALERTLLPATAALPVGDVGTHAAAFALLARTQGLPTRIVVGYRLPAAANGVVTVTTADAYAWDQVSFPGYGWVDFDPTDLGNTALAGPVTAPLPAAAAPAAAPGAPPSAAPSTGAAPALHRDRRASPSRLWVGVAAGLLAVLLLALVGNAVAKARRRAWRRSGGPAHRVAGAWLEATDYLAEAGVRYPAALTVEEVARQAAAADPATRRGRLQRRAAATLAALAPPTAEAIFSGRPGVPVWAEAAWRSVRLLPRALYPGRLALWRAAHLFVPVRVRRGPRTRRPPGGPP